MPEPICGICDHKKYLHYKKAPVECMGLKSDGTLGRCTCEGFEGGEKDEA